MVIIVFVASDEIDSIGVEISKNKKNLEKFTKKCHRNAIEMTYFEVCSRTWSKFHFSVWL